MNISCKQIQGRIQDLRAFDPVIKSDHEQVHKIVDSKN